MSFLTPINERSLPNTPAPSSINDTVHTKSDMNPHVGGMETVVEEEEVGNVEAQPEGNPDRKFSFRRRKGMPRVEPRMSRIDCLA